MEGQGLERGQTFLPILSNAYSCSTYSDPGPFLVLPSSPSQPQSLHGLEPLSHFHPTPLCSVSFPSHSSRCSITVLLTHPGSLSNFFRLFFQIKVLLFSWQPTFLIPFPFKGIQFCNLRFLSLPHPVSTGILSLSDLSHEISVSTFFSLRFRYQPVLVCQLAPSHHFLFSPNFQSQHPVYHCAGTIQHWVLIHLLVKVSLLPPIKFQACFSTQIRSNSLSTTNEAILLFFF